MSCALPRSSTTQCTNISRMSEISVRQQKSACTGPQASTFGRSRSDDDARLQFGQQAPKINPVAVAQCCLVEHRCGHLLGSRFNEFDKTQHTCFVGMFLD